MTNSELLRALATEASMIGKEPEAEEKKEEKKTNSPFTLTLAEYPDFIVTRTSARMIQHLVVMPSAGAAFIKTEAKGETTNEALTEDTDDTYALFDTIREKEALKSMSAFSLMKNPYGKYIFVVAVKFNGRNTDQLIAAEQ